MHPLWPSLGCHLSSMLPSPVWVVTLSVSLLPKVFQGIMCLSKPCTIKDWIRPPSFLRQRSHTWASIHMYKFLACLRVVWREGDLHILEPMPPLVAASVCLCLLLSRPSCARLWVACMSRSPCLLLPLPPCARSCPQG